MAHKIQSHPIWTLYPSLVSKEFLKQQLSVALAQRTIGGTHASLLTPPSSHEVGTLKELEEANKIIIDHQNKLILALQKRIVSLEGQMPGYQALQGRVVALEGQIKFYMETSKRVEALEAIVSQQRNHLEAHTQFVSNK